MKASMWEKCSLMVINGKFLSQKVTGVQRYAREIIIELDKLADGMNIELLTDSHAQDIPKLKNIRIVRAGHFSGNLWEQISLPLYVIKHKAICVSLCNMAPILTPHIVVIHDVSFKVNKHFFSKKFTFWYNFVFTLIIKRIKKIVTVSQFSRSEIHRVFGVEETNIAVTYNGWQHYQRIRIPEGIPEKYGLSYGEYYFAMSSMAPNKNFRWIARAAKNNPGRTFAVSGAINSRVFGDIFDFEIPRNLKFLGYVSDEEAKALCAGARAFLFPSFYEGFGIPPLEALSTGTQAVVADTSCMREIFNGCVHYISPDTPDVDLDEITDTPCAPSGTLLEKYSWEKSAEILLSVIRKLMGQHFSFGGFTT